VGNIRVTVSEIRLSPEQILYFSPQEPDKQSKFEVTISLNFVHLEFILLSIAFLTKKYSCKNQKTNKKNHLDYLFVLVPGQTGL